MEEDPVVDYEIDPDPSVPSSAIVSAPVEMPTPGAPSAPSTTDTHNVTRDPSMTRPSRELSTKPVQRHSSGSSSVRPRSPIRRRRRSRSPPTTGRLDRYRPSRRHRSPSPPSSSRRSSTTTKHRSKKDKVKIKKPINKRVGPNVNMDDEDEDDDKVEEEEEEGEAKHEERTVVTGPIELSTDKGSRVVLDPNHMRHTHKQLQRTLQGSDRGGKYVEQLAQKAYDISGQQGEDMKNLIDGIKFAQQDRDEREKKWEREINDESRELSRKAKSLTFKRYTHERERRREADELSLVSVVLSVLQTTTPAKKKKSDT